MIYSRLNKKNLKKCKAWIVKKFNNFINKKQTKINNFLKKKIEIEINYFMYCFNKFR